MARRDSITALLQGSRGGGGVSSKSSSRIFQENANIIDDSTFEDLELELQHAKMQLQAEHDRLTELEENLKNVVDQQYKDESDIILKLRTSQDALRQQLSRVVESKLELCTTTAKEIDKLRSIIQLLMSQIFHLTGKTPQWLREQMNHNLQADHFGSVTHTDENKNDIEEDLNNEDEESKAVLMNDNESNDNNMQNSNNKNNRNNNNKETPYSPNNNHQQQHILKKRLPGQDETGFPHLNPSCVDIRNIKDGDGVTFPDPYCTVDIIYTGYVYEKGTGNWKKFTDDSVSETVFSTPLGSGQNIIGLEQAILTMSLGQIIKIWVPSRLGYGVYGAPELIPPHSDLIFQVQLITIKEAAISENNDDDISPNEEFHNFSINDDNNNNNNIQNDNNYNNQNNALNTLDDSDNDIDEPPSGFDQDL